MANSTNSAPVARLRIIAYWVTTASVIFELAVRGAWDVLRVPQVLGLIDRLGYPHYFLVILGIWKLLGAVALAIPRFPRLKEWGLCGSVFRFDGGGHLDTVLCSGHGGIQQNGIVAHFHGDSDVGCGTTPASTINGVSVICSRKMRKVTPFWMPRPDPMGAPKGITAEAPASIRDD